MFLPLRSRVKGPAFFLVGESDRVVRPQQVQSLHQAPVRRTVMNGTGLASVPLCLRQVIAVSDALRLIRLRGLTWVRTGCRNQHGSQGSDPVACGYTIF